MRVSIFDIFTIGIGPSSSHTVGPMRAAAQFLEALSEADLSKKITRIQVELFGSMGLTGKAHGAEKAILLGLEGEKPEDLDPDIVEGRLADIRSNQHLHLFGKQKISFQEAQDLIFYRTKNLPLHPNGLRFQAFDDEKQVLLKKEYYSVGGGFVVEEHNKESPKTEVKVPYPFRSGKELLAQGERSGLPIYKMILENEKVLRSEKEIKEYIGKIWEAMQSCVRRGFKQEGILPGGLKVERRAPKMHRDLQSHPERSLRDPLIVMDWVNLYALSVNEENAGGGRVVTAPTNGAAGIVPAVLHYYHDLHGEASEDCVMKFLLTAGAIAILFKENASISGAEVGCQGEVGVACSMAAAGLAAVKGGSNSQIENAAEIGMEHNLGLTCDPVGGLVQIPCIERNAMGAIKAINAARMALRGDGDHKISLDKVIKTMRDTGRDMQNKYKETSQGGLAINFVEC